MPKKTASHKVRQVKKVALPEELSITSTEDSCCSSQNCRLCGMSKTTKIALILGVVILFLVALNRGLIVSAIVNGKPIFRWTVNSTLMSRFGQQTIENMITEQLIADEAKKAKLTVTQKEIDAKEQEVLKSFGGNVTLDEVLKFQGMTKSDFDEQIKLQMMLTKLIGKDITITDEEIATYRTNNSASLVATEEASIQAEAREAILTQKVGEKIQPWFTELRSKAKIFTFAK
ncbi:MAG: Foldase protein PrsA [Microgenomates group bacterium GW2011_GWB1_40_9]|nr:MAG: Foldase protein PrsA [Microgenomates group bacterium GW2011_GWC1_39_12]KKR79813.1 MAG: Foldase protein PrsA [Microgenomates group bacterium GW2011_GWB1_40_9]